MTALLLLVNATHAVHCWAYRRGHARTERVSRALWLRLLTAAYDRDARGTDRTGDPDDGGPTW